MTMSQAMKVASKACQKLETLLFQYRVAFFWVGYVVAVHMLFRENAESFAESGKLRYVLNEVLINYADGLVRRGLSGEISIMLSRWFAGHPWIWAWFLSAAVIGLFFLLTSRLMRRLPEDPSIMPLVLAPWGLLFFAYDYHGSFRKETLGYIALAAILQGVISRNEGAARIWAVAGTAIFIAGIFMHEVIVFLLPALMMAYFLVSRRWPEGLKWFAGCAVGSVMVGVTIFGILASLPPPDLAPLCAAAQIPCAPQAFTWLTKSAGDGISFVAEIRGWKGTLIYASIALLAYVPISGFRIPSLNHRWIAAAILGPMICMAPIFVIAADWGRWIQMILLPLSLVSVAAVVAGFAEYRRVMPNWVAIAYVSTWSLDHIHAEYYFKALHLLPILFILLVFSFVWRNLSVR